MGSLKNEKSQQLFGIIDIAKFIFAFSVIFIHSGEGIIQNPYLACVVNSFNSLAVPFFFITSGFFFFKKIYSAQSDENARSYIKKYIFKLIKVYTIWSALMLPLRIAISESNVIVAFIKAVRIYLFIGDGQLWYMNALIVGLILIVILRKLKVPDYAVALISVVLFIIGIFINAYLESTPVSEYNAVLKIYYLIWGSNVKNGIFSGMLYCAIGMYLAKYADSIHIKLNSTVALLTALILFSVYSLSVYQEFEFRSAILPIVSIAVFVGVTKIRVTPKPYCTILRSMSTVLYLSHYNFVRAFDSFECLSNFAPVGIKRFAVVLILSVAFSALLVFLGEKNKKVKNLWQ
ncbi:MAG: acyltransferase family protein [Acutalibacteraceae bacterium]|nr:acyltransferase family protein [Acutalibacteraceae bacterium]